MRFGVDRNPKTMVKCEYHGKHCAEKEKYCCPYCNGDAWCEKELRRLKDESGKGK